MYLWKKGIPEPRSGEETGLATDGEWASRLESIAHHASGSLANKGLGGGPGGTAEDQDGALNMVTDCQFSLAST